MSDDAEMWKEWKKMKQDAATQRRGDAPYFLRAAGIPFTEHNKGAHLILDTKIGFIDFWPGTSKWKTRAYPPQGGYGISNLFEFLK